MRAVTRASQPGIADFRGDELVVRLQSAPADNAANEELIERLADALGMPKRNVSIVSGHHSRTKRVSVAGIDAATAWSRLRLERDGK